MRILKSLLNKAKRLNDKFYLEFSGSLFCLWRISKNGKNISYQETTPEVFNENNLIERLIELEYTCQIMTVVLHPPTVCIKTYTVSDKNDISEWLKNNINSVFPPGNRHDLSLRYHSHDKKLLFTFIKKEVLTSFRDTIIAAGASYDFFVSAVGLEFAKLVINEDEGQINIPDWTLCKYQYDKSDSKYQITFKTHETKMNSNVDIHQEQSSEVLPYIFNQGDYSLRNKKVRKIVNLFNYSNILRNSNFIHLPRLNWAVIKLSRIALLFFLAALIISISQVGYGLVTKSNDNQIITYAENLEELEAEFMKLQLKIQDNKSISNIPISGTNLFQILSDKLPKSSWLETIDLQYLTREKCFEFNITGYSYDEGEIVSLGDVLKKIQYIRDANLVSVSKPNDVFNQKLTYSQKKKVKKFELTGLIDARF